MVPPVKTVTLLTLFAALVLAIVSAQLFAQEDPPEAFQFDARPTATAAAGQPAEVVVVKRAMTPDEFEARAMKWLSVGSTFIMGLLGLVLAVWMRVIDMRRAIEKAREEDQARMARQSVKTGSLEERMTALAMATPAGAQTLRTSAPFGVTAPGKDPTAGTMAVVAFALFLSLSACATTTGDPVKDARGRATNQALVEAGKILGKMATSAIFTAARNEFQGGNADMGDSAAAGLWANVNSADTGAAIKRVVAAYSAGTAPKTASTAQAAAIQAIDQGQPAPEVVNAIATVVSAAAEDERPTP